MPISSAVALHARIAMATTGPLTTRRALLQLFLLSDSRAIVLPVAAGCGCGSLVITIACEFVDAEERRNKQREWNRKGAEEEEEDLISHFPAVWPRSGSLELLKREASRHSEAKPAPGSARSRDVDFASRRDRISTSSSSSSSCLPSPANHRTSVSACVLLPYVML